MDENQLSLVIDSKDAAEFLEIGKILATEKDTSRLFEKIIRSSMNMTLSEYGAAYLIIDTVTGKLSNVSVKQTKNILNESDPGTETEHETRPETNPDSQSSASQIENRLLLLAVSKNIEGRSRNFVASIPVKSDSIEGYTVISGRPFIIDDVYKIDPAIGIKFDQGTDKETGSRTKSVLCIPMKDHSGNITGLIILINKMSKNEVISFTNNDRVLMNSFAGQAAAALENIRLYRETQELLESYKKQNSQLEELSRRILIAHEEERKRVARDIHDGPAQSAASLSFKLEIVRKLIQSKKSDQLEIELNKLGEDIRSTVSEIRTIIYDLRPSFLDNGLEEALKNRVAAFMENSGIKAAMTFIGDDAIIPYYMSSTIYKVIQEAMNNIQKHSQAKNVSIAVHISTNALTVMISDDGKGFEKTGTDAYAKGHGISSSGFGLQGMRERIEIVKGSMEVDSKPGEGTRIRFDIPLTL